MRARRTLCSADCIPRTAHCTSHTAAHSLRQTVCGTQSAERNAERNAERSAVRDAPSPMERCRQLQGRKKCPPAAQVAAPQPQLSALSSGRDRPSLMPIEIAGACSGRPASSPGNAPEEAGRRNKLGRRWATPAAFGQEYRWCWRPVCVAAGLRAARASVVRECLSAAGRRRRWAGAGGPAWALFNLARARPRVFAASAKWAAARGPRNNTPDCL